MQERKSDEMRPVEIVRSFTRYSQGSVLIKQGATWVLCTASIEEKVPPFLKGKGAGWVTAEYAMLPSATATRKPRERGGKLDSRSTEISRLVGRALRASIDMSLLGERQITIDCDVLQADGGTRCASITGGMVALADAVQSLLKAGTLTVNPLRYYVAALSVGMCQGVPTLDLDYAHDSTADVDLNVIMTDTGRYVELQGTAERVPFSDEDLDHLRGLAKKGLAELFKLQKA